MSDTPNAYFFQHILGGNQITSSITDLIHRRDTERERGVTSAIKYAGPRISKYPPEEEDEENDDENEQPQLSDYRDV